MDWARETTIKMNKILGYHVIFLSKRTTACQLYVTISCKRGGVKKRKTKPRVDDEEILMKRRGPYGSVIALLNYKANKWPRVKNGNYS